MPCLFQIDIGEDHIDANDRALVLRKVLVEGRARTLELKCCYTFLAIDVVRTTCPNAGMVRSSLW